MAERLKVLITAPYVVPIVDRFLDRFEAEGIEVIIHEVAERAGEEELLEIIGEIDGVICGDDAFTREVLEKAGRLKVISKWGTGIDSIDQEACAERGVVVHNTPDAFSKPVADSVLGYALIFARRLPEMDLEMKGGGWRKIPGVSLSEWTFGIVGVGKIGSQVARRVASFGAMLLGNDIKEIPAELLDATGMKSVGLEELLGKSDIVSLNCDLNPTSYHLIDREKLSLMKPGAYLINTSRGDVVAEDDLIEALMEGRLAGVALDVYEEEPLPEESPLRRLDNVLLAPHNANSSPAAWEFVHENTVNNLLSVLRSRPAATRR